MDHHSSNDPPPAPEVTVDYDRVIRTCPVCGRELEERKCKLICTDPRCGYYMSCADFY